jgi:hypothetical protein
VPGRGPRRARDPPALSAASSRAMAVNKPAGALTRRGPPAYQSDGSLPGEESCPDTLDEEVPPPGLAPREPQSRGVIYRVKRRNRWVAPCSGCLARAPCGSLPAFGGEAGVSGIKLTQALVRRSAGIGRAVQPTRSRNLPPLSDAQPSLSRPAAE